MTDDPCPTPTADQVEAYLNAACVVLNIDIPTEYRGGVAGHLRRLLQFGAQVMNFPLPDDTEVAPVFHP